MEEQRAEEERLQRKVACGEPESNDLARRDHSKQEYRDQRKEEQPEAVLCDSMSGKHRYQQNHHRCNDQELRDLLERFPHRLSIGSPDCIDNTLNSRWAVRKCRGLVGGRFMDALCSSIA